MYTKKIVFAGGPGTGKTVTLKALADKNYCCRKEISRQVTLEAQNKGISQLFLKDPLLFSQKLLAGRVNQFKETKNLAKNVCFFDRGIPEVSAYMDYQAQSVPDDFKEANMRLRYDMVFIFPLWEEIYQSDNERYESFSQAVEIQKFIEKTYRNLGYSLIKVPKATVEDRVDFILNKANNAESK